MKMNLNLTLNESMEVLNALHETAMAFGYKEEEWDAGAVIAEYSAVVDAALAAMGIEMNIQEEEEEDDYAAIEEMIFESNGQRMISQSDANEIILSLIDLIHEYFPDDSGQEQFATFVGLWEEFLADFNIDAVADE